MVLAGLSILQTVQKENCKPQRSYLVFTQHKNHWITKEVKMQLQVLEG